MVNYFFSQFESFARISQFHTKLRHFLGLLLVIGQGGLG